MSPETLGKDAPETHRPGLHRIEFSFVYPRFDPKLIPFDNNATPTQKPVSCARARFVFPDGMPPTIAFSEGEHAALILAYS